MIRTAILTVSDKGSRGERVDESGQIIRDLITRIEGQVVEYRIVPDERPEIANALAGWADRGDVDLVLTTGGTGLSPRDVTPEATRDVIDREVPGIGEVMRAAGLQKTPRAMLSRGIAGTRGRTLIVNLPGSPKGVRENLEAVLDVLPHAVEILQARPTDHA